MKANHEQLADWYLSLPPVSNAQEKDTFHQITKRLQALGGLTPEVSIKSGWNIDTKFQSFLYISKGRIMRTVKDPMQFSPS